jgi:hypothetical protein
MNICNIWQSVSKRKDYLATAAKILKDLYDVAGSRLTRSYNSTEVTHYYLNHARRQEHTDVGATVCNKSYRNQLLAK